MDGTKHLFSLSCLSSTLCLAGDNSGNLVTSTNPTQGASATWSVTSVDGSNTLHSIACSSAALCVAGDAEGNVVAATDSEISDTYTPNADDELSAETESTSGQAPISYSYGYNASDQVNSSSATGISNDSGSYGYDAAGNPESLLSQSQNFNSADGLTSSSIGSSVTQYGYDGIGDRVSTTPPSGTAASYSYNQLGQMVGATPAGSSTRTAFAYNGDGLRMSKTTNGSTENFTWDTNSSPQLLVDSTTNFVYGPNGSVLEQEDNSSTGDPLFYLQGSVGSTRALLSLSGAVVAAYAYSSYGSRTTLLQIGAAQTPIGYAGAYADSETGFLYLINRYYDPTTAQFLTVDPDVGTTDQPYSYAGDNPANAYDPSGLEGWLYQGLISTGFTATGAQNWVYDLLGLVSDVESELTFSGFGSGPLGARRVDVYATDFDWINEVKTGSPSNSSNRGGSGNAQQATKDRLLLNQGYGSTILGNELVAGDTWWFLPNSGGTTNPSLPLVNNLLGKDINVIILHKVDGSDDSVYDSSFAEQAESDIEPGTGAGGSPC